ncbi:MAG: RNA-binding S4 domain-containing protein [Alphaproteobacteria bacterium]|nr:RNA-binding S4 domain-containing protein [Alphaproteobacteria bacterium]
MSEDRIEKLRIDKWLWHARFFKSRTLAAKRVAAGGVRVNRKLTRKANHPVQPGDVLTFPLGPHVRVIEIVALGERRGPAVEARTLFQDLDPPVPRRAVKEAPPASGHRAPGAGRPTKKERRAVDSLREPED